MFTASRERIIIIFIVTYLLGVCLVTKYFRNDIHLENVFEPSERNEFMATNYGQMISIIYSISQNDAGPSQAQDQIQTKPQVLQIQPH